MSEKTLLKAGGLAALIAGAGLAGGCTSDELAVFSATLNEEMANAAYTAPYNGAASYSAGAGYSGPYWSPRTFGSYGGWPSAYSYGDFVGYNQCRSTGTLYSCDTNGDGLADMYGNTETGSFSSSTLRVNGRGEAFTWGSDCGCWERNRAYDGPRQPDEIIIRDEREED